MEPSNPMDWFRVPRSSLDLKRTPGRYPGPAPTTSGLLTAREFLNLHLSVTARQVADLLRSLGAAPLAARTPILAVGSNANPDVLRRKLLAARTSPTVLYLRCTVTHLAVGHSAHVSGPGYLPAAPFHLARHQSRLFLLLLDARQVAAVDATEPNYHRRRLAPDDYPVEVADPGVVNLDLTGGVDVYDSHHGLLIGPSGDPLRLTSQERAREALVQGRRSRPGGLLTGEAGPPE